MPSSLAQTSVGAGETVLQEYKLIRRRAGDQAGGGQQDSPMWSCGLGYVSDQHRQKILKVIIC